MAGTVRRNLPHRHTATRLDAVRARDRILRTAIVLIALGFALLPIRPASAACPKGVVCWKWTAVETKGEAPLPRWGHSAVWTGKEMLIFGGQEDLPIGPRLLFPLPKTPGSVHVYFNDLWSYNPSTKTWKRLHPSGGPPTPRANHTAVWTGHEMLIHAGSGEAPQSDIWAYRPDENHWEQLTVLRGTPPHRWAHTAVWASDANNPGLMIIFGGVDTAATPVIEVNDTLGFDLAHREWASSVNIGLPLPSARWSAAAVWSGRLRMRGGMWLFGGCALQPYAFQDTWHWISAFEFDRVHPSDQPAFPPSPRCFHTASLIEAGTWSWMVVFGGSDGLVVFNDLHALILEGAKTGNWIDIPTPDDGRPPPRQGHTAVWTGKEMLVFGGSCTNFCPKPTGNTLWSLRPPPGYLP
jgi:hypothetical protein